jgi:hypothetical protein
MNKLLAGLLLCITSTGFSSMALAADSGDKATYKAAKDRAEADYKAARAKCDPMSGNAKDVCVAEAKAAEKKAKAEAEAQYKNTDRARKNARTAAADADYDVAKAKCDAKSGNDKDVCIKEAKDVRTHAIADAKASKKVSEAKEEARDDKRDADYKVAVEKCDAMTGSAKDNCVTAAKSKYGK